MITPDISNTLFQLAADFVNHTSRHVFLTGKAGTGKTTFLKYIKEHTNKNAVVVAPTGVAAINASGVTMHSFFQLPFGPFIPGNKQGFSDEVTDRHTLFKQMRLSSAKKELMQELDLLIIDEVSMMRCDMLDAIDAILRTVRKNHLIPFGGVQVLYIGDLYQLPPVVQDHEWRILSEYYEGPFFFHAKVIEQSAPLYIELKKIYRQNEQVFIDILNRIRNNVITAEDLILLNGRFQINPAISFSNCVTLTTHNKKADVINTDELLKLPGRSYYFEGEIKGEFNEYAMPTDLQLQLKVGAQIMFIKNDSGDERRYFNGKLATITGINHDTITVRPVGEEESFQLEKETWQNIRYTFNRESNSIQEEVLGSFIQYPIRLAWAITIHKSQGLTFEKAIIDAGQSFTAGQVYVALSRCVSLEGVTLLSRIYPSAIQTNPQVIAFAEKEAAADELHRLLEKEKNLFAIASLINLFDWKKMINGITDLNELADVASIPDKNTFVLLADQLIRKITEQNEVAEKFIPQLKNLVYGFDVQPNYSLLQQRMTRAIGWFCKSIYDELIVPLHNYILTLEGKSRIRQFLIALMNIEVGYWNKLEQLQQATFFDISFIDEKFSYSRNNLRTIHIKPNSKAIKGSSQKESLDQFRTGKTIAEIASYRNLAIGTIEGHLAQFITTGEVEIGEVMQKDKVDRIMDLIDRMGDDNSSTLFKEKLGEDFSYSEIRMVMNHRRYIRETKNHATAS